MSGGTASRWGVSRDHAVGDYDIFFLFDFDETHRSWPLKAAGYGGLAAVCDRDVIRGTINVGLDRGRDEAHHEGVQEASQPQEGQERRVDGRKVSGTQGSQQSACIYSRDRAADAQPHS